MVISSTMKLGKDLYSKMHFELLLTDYLFTEVTLTKKKLPFKRWLFKELLKKNLALIYGSLKVVEAHQWMVDALV